MLTVSHDQTIAITREQRRQHDQQDGDAVDAHVVGDAEVGQPVDLLLELELGVPCRTAIRIEATSISDESAMATSDASSATARAVSFEHVRDEEDDQRADAAAA